MVGRWCALGVAAAMAVGAAACSGGGGQAAPPPTEASTTTTTSPPPTALTDEQAVLAAYQGYWDTWLAATNPPDPNHPDLSRYATGNQLERDQKAIANYRQLRQAVRLPPLPAWSHRPLVEAQTGDEAVVVDCSVDDSVLLDEPSGEVLNDEVATYRLRSRLVRATEGWRVEDLQIVAKWDGITGCAE